MRKHLIQFLLVAVLLVFTSAAWAQTTEHGQLVDAETGEPLVQVELSCPPLQVLRPNFHRWWFCLCHLSG